MRRRAALALLATPAALGLAAGRAARAQAAALPAVAVWDFDNQSPLPGAGGFLRRALSESLTAELLRTSGLPVVERHRLREVLAEQKLAASELADTDARLRLGRVIGAARMVFGGFFVLGEQVQVHVRVVDTATSRVLVSDELTGELATLMQQVPALNRRLARALGAVDSSPGLVYPARAWESHDRALALADAGRLDDAITALQSLLSEHKNFHPAERQLVALLEKTSRR